MTATKSGEPQPAPQGQVQTLDARTAEDASRQLSALYREYAPVESIRPGEPFRMRAQAVACPGFTLTKLDCQNWRHLRDSKSLIRLTVPLEGVLHYRAGGRHFDNEPQKHIAVGRPFESTAGSVVSARAINLTFPIDGIVERAGRMTGESGEAHLLSRMADQIDGASPIAQALARTMKTAMVEISALGAVGMNVIVVEGYRELLLNLAVACLSPQVAKQMHDAPLDCGPTVVRRARDFIRANAAEPIELSRLAADLGVGMRTMQVRFQRQFGCSPREYVMRCRLENARQLLLTPGASQTVSGIAMDCGFSDFSHFSARYRDSYGEPPSETLRNAQERFR